MGYGNGMHTDTGIKFSMSFSHEKFTGKISCLFIGTGIGMPMYSGIKIFQKFWLLKIWPPREFLGKCWINTTKITVASHGSHPCIQ